MELFSEIYSAYFRTVERILRKAQKNPLTDEEIQKILTNNTFSESVLSIFPKLQNETWPLLRKTDGGYVASLSALPENPLSRLQKAWLHAAANDPRFRLFFKQSEINALKESLSDTEPLYEQEHFYFFDKALDGDDYESSDYQTYFRFILSAILQKSSLHIQYEGSKGKRFDGIFQPLKLEYSSKDDKLRAHCIQKKGGNWIPYILNLGRMISVNPLDIQPSEPHPLPQTPSPYPSSLPFKQAVIEITKERNALERCMVQFAHFEKRTEYDEATDKYTCTIHYHVMDETEVLIRMLSFGPTIKVLGPPEFLYEIKNRVQKQALLLKGIHSNSNKDQEAL